MGLGLFRWPRRTAGPLKVAAAIYQIDGYRARGLARSWSPRRRMRAKAPRDLAEGHQAILAAETDEVLVANASAESAVSRTSEEPELV